MKHKLIFIMNGQTFTVFKTQNEIINILSVDGVQLVSVNDNSVDTVSSMNVKDRQLEKAVTRQRRLQIEKGIKNKELEVLAGVTAGTMCYWLDKDDEQHYQKIVSLIEQIERNR